VILCSDQAARTASSTSEVITMEVFIALLLALAIITIFVKFVGAYWRQIAGALGVLFVVAIIGNAIAPEKPLTTATVTVASATTPAPAIDHDAVRRADALASAARLAAYEASKQPVMTDAQWQKTRMKTADEAAKLEAMNWHIGGFGSVMVVDRVTIKNEGQKPIARIVIECEMSSKSGVPISRLTFTVHEIVKPGKSGTFRNISAGFIDQQTGNASCGVKDATYISG
jgi:hypothetical protein